MKAQLTAQADLVKSDPLDDGETFDEEELQVLRDAGIIPDAPVSKCRKRRSTAKHIVFAEDVQQGWCMHLCASEGLIHILTKGGRMSHLQSHSHIPMLWTWQMTRVKTVGGR